MPRLPILCVALGLWPVTLAAHPHVFVDTKTGFYMDEDGVLTGLHISWTYDPFTTLFLFDVLDLDRDRDGALNDEDYAAILRGETEWAEDYVGDIYLEVNAEVHPHLKPVDAEAEYLDDQITVRFDLPLVSPVTVPGQDVVLRVYDPNYYYAYSVLDTSSSAPLPNSCNTTLYPFKPEALSSDLLVILGSMARDEMPEQQGVGRFFSDEVVLTCD